MRAFISVSLTVLFVGALLTGFLRWDGSAEAKPKEKDNCPSHLKHRLPEKVIEDHLAALADADWDALACNYDANAFVINDQGIDVGRDEIVSTAIAFDDVVLDGATRQVTQVDVFRDVVRVLYGFDGGWFVIPDGINTYRIEKGLIISETNHGLIEFLGPPPEEE